MEEIKPMGFPRTTCWDGIKEDMACSGRNAVSEKMDKEN